MKQWAKFVAILALGCALPACESDVVDPVIDDGYVEDDDDKKMDPEKDKDDKDKDSDVTSEECEDADNGAPCTGEAKSCGKWLCMNKACILVPKDSGSVCRAAAGECDVDEVCDGTSTDCPEDKLKSASDVCREAVDDCDEAEYCDGTTAACPADVKDTTSAECQEPKIVEDCTSIADNTPCVGDATACGEWVCKNDECTLQPVEAGKVCREAVDACDIEDVCDGTTTDCPVDLRDTTSTACMVAVEDCTGIADDAPCVGDEIACGKWVCRSESCTLIPKGSGIVCRDVAGDCDVAEYCDGESAECPADGYKASGEVCRAAADSCDIVEVCDGASAACPADVKDTTSEGCEPPVNECAGMADGTSCSGEEKSCGSWVCISEACTLMPKAMGVVCRDAVGLCDQAEICDGVSADCPADVLKSATEVCRPKAGTCDVEEMCDGVSSDCPADAKDTTSDGCRPVTGECALRADGTPCSGGDTACGSRVCVNKECVLSPKMAGTVCRDANGVCDVAEVCDGASTECPADTFKSSGQECRPVAGDCDVAEYCTGSSKDCPADTFKPASIACRASGGVCDVAEYCTGSSKDCPSDRFESTSKVCRASAGDCDEAERCTGASATCPSDTYKSSGSQCYASQYVCDSADYCDGRSKTCSIKLTNSCSCPAANKVASGYGLTEGSGVTPFRNGASDYRGFFLKDDNTWTTNEAFIKSLGSVISVENLNFDQAMQQVQKTDAFYTDISKYQGFKRAYRWNSTDETVKYWGPQGISSGTRGDREFKAVAWHYVTDDAGSDPSPAADQSDKNKGIRVSFIETSTLSSVKYTHALLADISSGKLVPIKNNAGGVAWSWPYLYVASTSKGLRVFDMRTILKADTSKDCQTRIGTYNGKLCAYGLPYILPQISAYSQPGATGTNCDLKFSYISIERRSGTNNSILAGEYFANSGNESTCMYSRLIRYPMKNSGGKLATNSYNIVEPEGGWFTGTCNIQGATSNNDTFLLSSTRKYGALYASKAGQATAKTYDIKSMPQGIHVTAKDNAWLVATGRNSVPRLVYYLDVNTLTP